MKKSCCCFPTVVCAVCGLANAALAGELAQSCSRSDADSSILSETPRETDSGSIWASGSSAGHANAADCARKRATVTATWSTQWINCADCVALWSGSVAAAGVVVVGQQTRPVDGLTMPRSPCSGLVGRSAFWGSSISCCVCVWILWL